VVDVGPNANQTVQLYDLTMFVGGTAFTPTGTAGNAPPDAIAGLNKRVAANTTCYLIGDVNSSATMPGVTLSSYAWDSDNDGVFDLTGAKPTTVYVSNGVYPVTLRVTDSRSSTDTDTINVTVFGATTSVSSLSPNNGDQGAVVPFTIVGTNLLGVTNASQLTVSGTGVTVTGTPVRTPRGTAVTGVSFNVAANATPGPRNVSIANPDGLGAPAFLIANAFTVNAPPPPSCPADIANSDGDPGADGVIDNGDFTLFFSAFFALPGDPIRTFADIANSDGDPGADGAVDNGDFTLFFGSFFSPCN
jgi:PKD repeat protein